MGTLVIKVPASVFSVTAPPALTCFSDLEGRGISALPKVEDDNVVWSVPDTPANREAFRRNYEPDENFSCNTVDLEAPKPFSVSRKEAAKPTVPPKTVAKAK